MASNGLQMQDNGTDSDERSCYHPLFIGEDSVEMIVPIEFEDGMEFDECERYYACLLAGESRNAYHLSRAAKARRPPTTKHLKQCNDGKLPSCLRAPKLKTNSRRPIQRSASFHVLPSMNDLYAHHYGSLMQTY